MKIKNLKKKLFIAGANLLILLALLIYVSYSAYRIHVAAEVEMLEAARMRASLEMTYDLTNGAKNDPNNKEGITDQDNLLVLDKLVPGEDASEYRSNTAKAVRMGREVTFKVVSLATMSMISIGDQTQEATFSEVPMGIKVIVEETGPIPLEIILADENSNFICSGTTDTSYGFDKPKTVRFYKDNQKTKEYMFRLDTPLDEEKQTGAGGKKASRTFKLYIGWNNKDYQSTSATIQNEVATINVRAELVQLPPEVSEKEWNPSPTTASEIHVYHVKKEE